MGLFKSTVDRIRQGLARTREAVAKDLRATLHGRPMSSELIDEIEVYLISADVGVATTGRIIAEMRTAFEKGEVKRGGDALDFLRSQLKAQWTEEGRELAIATQPPTVILVAGVNGSGKTTSVAKIAKSLRDDGRTVLLAAADTFRAGAVAQLATWADRLDVEIIKGAQGADPAAVVFDAVDAAIARGTDVLLVDTAGRLQTQDPLMRQLTKIRDVLRRRIPEAPHEVLLVLDATTGQNAIRQAQEFTRAIDVTGIFLAKLDGTAKGGVVLAIHDELAIPVKLVGVGETPEDVEPFDPDAFVDAMFE